MPKNFFDIVCLGFDLSGLVASTLLARQGYRTLILRRAVVSSEGAGAYPRSGIRQSPLLFIGQHSSPVLRQVLVDLGLTQELRNRLLPLDPAYQVLMPGHRLDLGGTAPDTREEVARELPEARDRLDPLLGRIHDLHEQVQSLFEPPLVLPPVGFWQRRALVLRLRAAGLSEELGIEDPLGGLGRDDPLRLFFELPCAFLVSSDSASLGRLARCRLLGHLQHGVSFISGSRDGLAELVLDRFSCYGGVLDDNSVAEGIELGWGKAPLISLSHSGEEIGCNQILFNQDAQRLPELLPPSQKRSALQELVDRVRVGSYRATLCLSVRSEAIPAAMGRLAFLVGDHAAPLIEENLVMITVQGEGGAREITASVHLKGEGAGLGGEQGLRGLKDRILARLHGLLPFLDRHTLECGEIEQADLQPLYSTGPAGLDTLGLLPYRTPYKKILLCCSQILPGLGLEGEFLAGVSACKVAGSVVKRRNLLPR